ncbi:tRNA (5-methylaminomethyl-2-thiouridine)(34)-methyltransferase MnmD [Leptolyngbyaceae cyanobacterium UHCC 1019]
MSEWIPQLTEDGSFTFFSETFNEAFHSRLGAKQEAFLKFAQATDLATQAEQSSICLLDVCYGLGYNTAAALEVIWTVNPSCQVTLYALELDISVPQAAIAPLLINTWSSPVQEILKEIAQQHHCTTPTLNATLLIGDARQTIQQLCQINFQADAIFFDPFSPRRCPQLWTVEFFTLVAQCLTPMGKLATYSRSASVRSAMLEAGLTIGTIPLELNPQPNDWSHGTVGSFQNPLHPLSQLEQEHLQTRAAIAYHDRSLSDSTETILQRQTQEQQQSQQESTSSWRRRWNIP